MGFYSALEKVSDWIDDQIDRPFTLNAIADHINKDNIWIRRLCEIKPDTELKRKWLAEEIYHLENRMCELSNLYNREKYWWMRRK